MPTPKKKPTKKKPAPKAPPKPAPVVEPVYLSEPLAGMHRTVTVLDLGGSTCIVETSIRCGDNIAVAAVYVPKDATAVRKALAE